MPGWWQPIEELVWIKCLTDNIWEHGKITLVKSKIGSDKTQVGTIQALGLKKTNSSVEKEATPQILGMVAKISHLVRVEEVK